MTANSDSAYLLGSGSGMGEDVSTSSRRSARSSLTAIGDWSYRGNTVSGRGRSHGGGGVAHSNTSLAEVSDYRYTRRGHCSHNGTSSSGGHSFVPLAQYLSSRKASITGGTVDVSRSCLADVFQTGLMECEGLSPTRPLPRSRNNSYAGLPIANFSNASMHSQPTSPAHYMPGSSTPLTSSGMFSASGILLSHTSAPNLPALGGSIWSDRDQATTAGGRNSNISSGTNVSERSSILSTYDRSSVCTNERSSVCTNDRSSVSTNDRSSILSNGRSSISNVDRTSSTSQALAGGGGGSNRPSQNHQRTASGVVFNPAMGLHEDTVYSWIGASGAHSVSVSKLQRQFSQRRSGGAADGGLRPGSIKISNNAVEPTTSPVLKDWRVDSQSSQKSMAVAAGRVLHRCEAS